MLTSAETMAYYNTEAWTNVIVNASPVGLGAALSRQHPRWIISTSTLHQSSAVICQTSLFTNGEGSIGSGMGLWTIPHLYVLEGLWTGHGSQTFWDHLYKTCQDPGMNREMGTTTAALHIQGGVLTGLLQCDWSTVACLRCLIFPGEMSKMIMLLLSD